MTDAQHICVFVDYENVAIGASDARLGALRLDLVLTRMHELGTVILKRAYGDWTRFKADRPRLHALGFELIEVPHVNQSGKNSADIRMCVDAIDVCHTKPHLDLFTIVSGDSDFSPLAAKLRENAKRVVGIGVKDSTSALLVESCDEFVYYEDLFEDVSPADDALTMVATTAAALLRDRGGEPVFGSHVKQVLKRKRPNFRERHYGYRSFSDVLEAAATRDLLELRKDDASGGFVVLGAEA